MATVFVRLPDEGVDVWRPVPATASGNRQYRLIAADEYDPMSEAWEFPPGAIVEGETRQLSDGPAMVAVRLAHRPANSN
jgi:hypothetical protein